MSRTPAKARSTPPPDHRSSNCSRGPRTASATVSAGCTCSRWIVDPALAWLAGVVRTPQRSLAPLPESDTAFRAYAPKELAKLDADCRGFLLFLERSGILSPATREHVIERALATAGDTLSLEQIKLIVLMVLWNQKAPASHLVAEELLSVHGNRLPS